MGRSLRWIKKRNLVLGAPGENGKRQPYKRQVKAGYNAPSFAR